MLLTLFLYLLPLGEAYAQQCRLAHPTGSQARVGSIGESTSAQASPSPSTIQTSAVSTTTSSSAVTATLAPFNYGQEPVRGVNLYVGVRIEIPNYYQSDCATLNQAEVGSFSKYVFQHNVRILSEFIS